MTELQTFPPVDGKAKTGWHRIGPALARLWTRIVDHKVAQWMLAYAAFAYACLHFEQMMGEAFAWHTAIMRITTIALIAGVPVMIALAWYLHKSARPVEAAAGPDSMAAAPPEKSIAVLPFVDMSELKDQEYFSDGLAEELIALLTGVSELRVPARTSSFYFKGKQATIPEIAQALHVAHVLEGSVRKAGNTIRVTVQLIRVDTGYHVWSQAYDRTLEDIFKVQDEIAAAVVRSLSVALLSDTLPARSALPNAEAYQLYLRGRFHWNQRSPDDFRKALGFFQQAIAIDPRYAPAYTGLADCYSLLPIYDRKARATETMPQAKTAILQALAIDDRLAEAHASLGLILALFEYDWTGAERQFQRAIELNPKAPAPHQWYGELLVNIGKPEAGLAESRAAVTLDPLSQVANLALGIALNSARRFDEAIAQLQATLKIGRKFADTNYFLFEAYANKSAYEEAVAVYARQKKLDGEPAASLEAFKTAFAYDAWPGFLRQRIKALESEQTPAADELASFHARLGEVDRAMAWLEKSYADRSARLTHLKVDARYDNLRADPRFANLLQRVGLAS
jgi:serine/threonine-protein kinase